ncbi:uncharacterized protein DDB_G0271670-like [Panonychus citri]|uniref:uncharacterized protein DDB_G0271670-like n=1 Tax=Panonychus citri TaxID=50023 RepID=UPI002307AFD9|nr:uncharacterized protein DDB_G0271670-like [Panonychus citri]
MHLFCIKLMTLLTLIKCSQSSILPSLITDKNPSHHQHHGSPSAFHDFSSSSSLLSSSSPPSNLDLLSSSSSSSSSLSFSSSSSSSPLSSSSSSSSSPSSTDVEISDIISESALNQNDNNNGDDRFHSLVSQESHNTQSGPPTNYNNNNNQNVRSSILLPKIYPSPVISDPFSSSNTFPSHSNSNPDEGKSLDYATTLIKEALEGPMMHDSNGDSSDYVESSSSSSSPSSSSEFDGTVGRMGSRIFGERKENGPSEIDSGIVGNIEEERKGSTSDEIEPGVASDGDEVNAVQPSEDQLFYEVQKLIQLIREAAAHTDEKGSSPKSRNNRNRLTLQMDYLQNLLDEYRQKQGSLNLRHWVRGVSPPRLSVTSPIAVLRDALMEEIKRKKIQETQAKIAMNEKILKEVG